ncbi:uncharacterized protein METZ01_LOCUS459733, partial [marine metagenome]
VPAILDESRAFPNPKDQSQVLDSFHAADDFLVRNFMDEKTV